MGRGVRGLGFGVLGLPHTYTLWETDAIADVTARFASVRSHASRACAYVFLDVYVCMYVCMYVCVCVCVRERKSAIARGVVHLSGSVYLCWALW
jgi:hypothetical protein